MDLINESLPIIIILVALFSLIFLFLLWFYNPIRKGFYRKKDVMTFQERKLYNFLSHTLTSFNVFPQVRLASVVTIPDNYFLWKTFIPLGGKCVDFVICDKLTGETKIVIELDDKSHKLVSRKKRDNFVNDVLDKAGIPILHQPLKETYQPEEIINEVKRKIGFYS